MGKKMKGGSDSLVIGTFLLAIIGIIAAIYTYKKYKSYGYAILALILTPTIISVLIMLGMSIYERFSKNTNTTVSSTTI